MMQDAQDAGPKDFFVSYNSADRSWAEWIAWQLEKAGYSVVIQAWDFQPGMNFALEMDDATKKAACTIAVLSPDYLRAPNPQAEWAAAFEKDPTGRSRALIPVRVRECDLKGLLAQIVYINLVGLDKQAAHEKLLAGVRRGRAKPAIEPGFPGAVAPLAAPGVSQSPPREEPPFPKEVEQAHKKSMNIFYCYAHEDEEMRQRLEKRLTQLKRQGFISGWNESEIGAGREWQQEIDKHLNAADIILLLISPDFMASDHCYDLALRATKRHDAGKAHVIPILLRTTLWEEEPFGKLRPSPSDRRPVKKWADQDDAFVDIYQGIRGVVEELKKNP